ncbi:MAG: hypothetical protein ACRBBK_02650 [Paracoccaceae bacterium]
MSDAMTNPEIEDVVSSIRRLVSEDVRPTARSQEDMQEAGKFVLTPALRVAETAPEHQAAQESPAEMQSEEEGPSEDWHPAEESAAQAEPSHEEPSHEEAHFEDSHHEGAHHSEETPHEEAQQAGESAQAGDEDAWSTSEHEEDHAAEDHAEDHHAEDHQAEDHSEDHHADSNDHSTDHTNAPQNDTLVLEGEERIDEAAHEEPAPSFEAQSAPEPSDPAAQVSSEESHSEDHTHDAPQDWQDEAKPAQSLEDRIADLEAAVGAQSDEWEPDGSEEETSAAPTATILQYSQSGFSAGAAGLSAAFEDANFDDPNAEPVQIEGASFDANDFGDDEDDLDGFVAGSAAVSEDAILDEAALRELVGMIVREELQGALGERITRNVRRLVRREVQRALSLREFE